MANHSALQPGGRANCNTETARRLDALRPCRQGAVLILAADGSTATLIPTSCKSWRCPKCGPKLRAIWSHRLAAAKPERFLTLTCDPTRFNSPIEAYIAMKRQFHKLIQRLRALGFAIQYAAIWEFTQADWPHLHVALKGDYLPQKIVSRIWDDLGIGYIVHLSAVRGVEAAARYLTKYMVKASGNASTIPRGQRLVLCSRHFYERPLPKVTHASDDGASSVYVRRHVASLIEDLWTFGRLQVDPRSSLTHLIFSRPAGPMKPSEREYLLDVLHPPP